MNSKLTEDDVLALARLEVQRHGGMVWRNNVGALPRPDGVPVRFGLANDSAVLNKRLKSSDLIGLTGLGRFLAMECKSSDWHWTGTDRERAQLAFIMLVRKRGGVAGFVRSMHDVCNILGGGSGAPHG